MDHMDVVDNMLSSCGQIMYHVWYECMHDNFSTYVCHNTAQ